jgi:hypothetical protein
MPTACIHSSNVLQYGAFSGYHKNLNFKELLISQCMCTLYTKVSYLSNFLATLEVPLHEFQHDS